ncbi:protein GPR107 [Aplysia californica]|uniref:Protein GPR107 n=1 Tax=Aplysia californica TaxID=6500 RepID=A0ABM1A653_APLCA|nr:protein GPR107 [Aplysia californica]
MAEGIDVNIIMNMRSLLALLCLVLSVQSVSGWIHHLKLVNDERRHIALTTSFGFLQGGTLDVNVTLFSYHGTHQNETNVFGFTLDKSRSSSVLTTMANSPQCKWGDPGKSVQSVSFRFDLPNQRILIDRLGAEVKNLTVTDTKRTLYLYQHGLAHGEGPVAAPKPAPTPASETSPTDVTAAGADGGGKKTTVATKEGGARKRRDATTEATAGKETTVDDKDRKANGEKDKKNEKDEKDKGGTPAAGEGKKTDAAGAVAEATSKAVAPTTNPAEQMEPQWLPMTREQLPTGGYVYRTHFLVHIKTVAEEGLYSFFFHNCMHKYQSPVNLSLDIVQDNNGNYLSAGEMPIPAMYFVMSIVFFILTVAWFSVLRKAEEGVYKLHYLMLVVVFFKSLSSLFHAVNLFMIQRTGIHVDAWAILWYIVYLMRGALMFLTILLIGAGWVFIKHVFTDREKKLFLIVIPLQILDNVAWVIMEESEEGNSSYDTWHKIFIGVDLLCCFTIFFPVIWSIRHLQEASKTDGKAAMNLVKLKLFRHYYFLVVCYFYFTRVIRYFLAVTLPFHYGWLENVFTETFLLIFFVLIGYKFQPMSDNPYLQVPQDSDEEIEMEEVLTKTGSTETVVRVNQGRGEEEGGSSTAVTVKQRESSHEYD